MDLNWVESSLILNEELLSVLRTMECGNVLLQDKVEHEGTTYIYPLGTNIFVADEEKVMSSRSFYETIKYYETKVEPSESEAFILDHSENSLDETKYNQEGPINELFSTLLQQVYMELPGISSISRFPYSIILKICNDDKNPHVYLSFLLEFISLCSLSTRVMFDDATRKYVFQIGSKIDSEMQKSIQLETVWNDTSFFKSKIFSTITAWVLDNKGIPNGHYLRRSVAQNYILGFEDSTSLFISGKHKISEIPDSLDNMFESVLNARSEKYIKNINKMKEDYIDSFNQYSQMMSSINTQTISNIFAMAAAAYGIFLTMENIENPLSFPGVKWILVIFIFTTSLIFINLVASRASLRSSLRTRQRFYSEILSVSNELLDKVYNRVNPELPKTWLFPAVLLSLILVFLFYLLRIVCLA